MKRTQRPTTVLQKLSRRRQPDDRGLTLVELLMVITILGILAGIALFSARSFRGEATASANETDSDVVRTAQETYCFKTGTYAARLSDMLTPPNDVLAEPDTYNASVRYEPEVYTGFGADDPSDSLFKGYRLGGAVDPDTPSGGCDGQSIVVGPLTDDAAPRGGTGPRVLADMSMKSALNFLADSFRERFGPVQFANQPIGVLNDKTTGVLTPDSEDWLVVSTSGPTAPPGQLATFRRFATGQLTLMACRAGGLSLPATDPCRAPGDITAPDLFNAPDVSGVTMPNLETDLGGAPADCGANPILVMEPPTTLFGNTARQSLIAEGVSGETIDLLAASTRNCIVYADDVAGVQALLRGGGRTASGTAVNPVKWALVSNSATTDPRAVDNNWKRVVAGFDLHASILANPPNSNGQNQVQARRFLNYLLSPAGQATLETYGFGKVPIADRVPLPENST